MLLKQNFLTNDKIHRVVVEKVPCTFSASGQHYVVVMLDDDNNLLYVESECCRRHDENSLLALHEMNGGNNDMCYQYVEEFLSIFDNLDGNHRFKSKIKISSPLYRLQESLFNRAQEKRFHRRPVRDYRRNRALTRIAQAVTGSPAFYVMGPQELKGPVTVHCGRDYQVSLRQENSSPEYTTPSTAAYTFSLDPYPRDYCVVCQSFYKRMSKHTHGGPHRLAICRGYDRVFRMLRPSGIKALNEKGLDFFKPRVRNTSKWRVEESYRLKRLARYFKVHHGLRDEYEKTKNLSSDTQDFFFRSLSESKGIMESDLRGIFNVYAEEAG